MASVASRMLPLAVVGEGALAMAGGVWLYAGEYPVRLGDTLPAVGAGLAVAAALAAVQWWLLTHAPGVGPVPVLRELQQTLFQPLFAPLSIAELAAISALAGLGEEIFFRGAVTAAAGWPAATLAFGVCHVGLTRRSWMLGVWATGAGAILASLAIVSDGLLAPIVAHASYDFAALVWLRRQARRPPAC
jgi:membrane protease YdiL (CAAX protease family)